jgi:hypothetical protein
MLSLLAGMLRSDATLCALCTFLAATVVVVLATPLATVELQLPCVVEATLLRVLTRQELTITLQTETGLHILRPDVSLRRLEDVLLTRQPLDHDLGLFHALDLFLEQLQQFVLLCF